MEGVKGGLKLRGCSTAVVPAQENRTRALCVGPGSSHFLIVALPLTSNAPSPSPHYRAPADDYDHLQNSAMSIHRHNGIQHHTEGITVHAHAVDYMSNAHTDRTRNRDVSSSSGGGGSSGLGCGHGGAEWLVSFPSLCLTSLLRLRCCGGGEDRFGRVGGQDRGRTLTRGLVSSLVGFSALVRTPGAGRQDPLHKVFGPSSN